MAIAILGLRHRSPLQDAVGEVAALRIGQEGAALAELRIKARDTVLKHRRSTVSDRVIGHGLKMILVPADCDHLRLAALKVRLSVILPVQSDGPLPLLRGRPQRLLLRPLVNKELGVGSRLGVGEDLVHLVIPDGDHRHHRNLASVGESAAEGILDEGCGIGARLELRSIHPDPVQSALEGHIRLLEIGLGDEGIDLAVLANHQMALFMQPLFSGVLDPVHHLHLEDLSVGCQMGHAVGKDDHLALGHRVGEDRLMNRNGPAVRRRDVTDFLTGHNHFKLNLSNISFGGADRPGDNWNGLACYRLSVRAQLARPNPENVPKDRSLLGVIAPVDPRLVRMDGLAVLDGGLYGHLHAWKLAA